MKRRWVLVVISLLAAQIAFAAPVAAADFGNCTNTHSNQFAGFDGPHGGQKHGVSGTIDGQTLHQCSNPGFIVTTGSFAWVAIEGNGGANHSGDILMQLGAGECRDPGFNGCDSGFKWYYAWGRDPSAPGCTGYSYRAAAPQTINGIDGATHDYKIYHQTNQWRFFIGASQKYAISESELCWTPTNAVWFEETWDNGDALGGSAGNHLTTALANYANAENGGFFWTNFTGACTYPQGAPRHCSRVDATTFDVWTDR